MSVLRFGDGVAGSLSFVFPLCLLPSLQLSVSVYVAHPDPCTMLCTSEPLLDLWQHHLLCVSLLSFLFLLFVSFLFSPFYYSLYDLLLQYTFFPVSPVVAHFFGGMNVFCMG